MLILRFVMITPWQSNLGHITKNTVLYILNRLKINENVLNAVRRTILVHLILILFVQTFKCLIIKSLSVSLRPIEFELIEINNIAINTFRVMKLRFKNEF